MTPVVHMACGKESKLLQEIEKCLKAFDQDIATLVANRTCGMPEKMYKEQLISLKAGRETVQFLFDSYKNK